MKRNTFEYPKSSFMGMNKDTETIMGKIMTNERLLKLLWYPVRDYADQPALTPLDKKKILESKVIWHVPKLEVDGDFLNYLRISYDSFFPTGNPQYRDNVIEFKIVCHFNNWDLGNGELRPYKIAGEIDSMFNNQRLSGIGLLIFLGADQDVYENEFGGVTLRYLATRGNEDKQPVDDPLPEYLDEDYK